MFTFIPMGNGFRRAAPLALIVAFGLAACGGGYSGGGGAGYGMSTARAGGKLFAAGPPHMANRSPAKPKPGAGKITLHCVLMWLILTGPCDNIERLVRSPGV